MLAMDVNDDAGIQNARAFSGSSRAGSFLQ